MPAFGIDEVPAFRLSDGTLVLNVDFQPVTAYRTQPAGEVFEAREEARASLVDQAARILADADLIRMTEVTSGADTDEASLSRYAILYLAAVIRGEA